MKLKYALLGLQLLSLTAQVVLLYWSRRHNRADDALPWQMGLLVTTIGLGVALRFV